MHLSIWTTSNCNLNCKYCYEDNDFQKHKGHLDVNIENQLIKWLKEKHELLEVVLFHGGEPLLNFQLIEKVVDVLKELNSDIIFGFTTNGTIWNEDIKSFLIRNKKYFQNSISISIDGKKDTHDYNRVYKDGTGTYLKSIDTAKELLDIFPKLRVRGTITPDTVTEIYNNIVHLNEFGFSLISLAFDYFDNRWNDNHIDIIAQEYEKIIRFWEKNKELEIGLIDEIRYRKKLGRCTTEQNIYIDGNIYPCTYVVGDSTQEIGDIYNELDQNKINNICEISNLDNKFCYDCINKSYCIVNRCKLMNKKVNGDYYNPIDIICALEGLKLRLTKKYNDIFFS